MTKRVIQTDLFAAFKDSQRRAEEKVGQKRKIRVEGSTVRRVEEHREKGDHGLELIHSKPVDTEATGSVATATAPAATRTIVATATETRAPAGTPRAPTTPTPTPAVDEQRTTVSYQEAARKTVTRTRQPLQNTPPTTAADAIRVNPPAATATATPSTGDDGGTLLKWATVILLIAAAYIVGERMGEEKATQNGPIGYIGEPDVDGNNTLPPVVEEEDPAPIQPAPTDEVEEPTVEPTAVEPTPVVPLGNKTVLVVSGIKKRQAEKVAELIRANSKYPVFLGNDAVYVGRFETFFETDINECQEFCRSLEFEGRKQFKDALQIPLPGSLSNENP